MSTAQATKSTMRNMNLTVVELFQSQGCSSCPPTNTNVQKLIEDPNLLVLTYHVTYWDRLGWTDTFGNSAFDQRQWEYARAMQRRNVYTPQVVINGQIEGVGNSAKGLHAMIVQGGAFSLMQTVKVDYDENLEMVTVSGPANERGLVTLIRYNPHSIQVRIPHGENGGRILPHSHIVTEVRRIGAYTSTPQSFLVPKAHFEDGTKVAILVQDGAGGPILGVVRI